MSIWRTDARICGSRVLAARLDMQREVIGSSLRQLGQLAI
jgi:hypothetical protein